MEKLNLSIPCNYLVGKKFMAFSRGCGLRQGHIGRILAEENTSISNRLKIAIFKSVLELSTA
jgi:hypothetical protein